MSTNEAALVREAVRVYRRYAVEIVEGLGFCPYAERARADGHTKEIVLTEEIPTDEDVEGAIERVAADENIQIGLVIFPRIVISRGKLGRWVEHLRKAHTRRHEGAAVLAIEGFHPDADPDTSTAERLTPFVRRTPDPTLQLTQLSVLERVRRGTPQGTAFFDPSTMSMDEMMSSAERAPLHERIADLNLETCLRLGVAEVTAKLVDILRDRDASYARIDAGIVTRS